MIKTGDEKNLAPEIREKQLAKGTHDSPCLAVCDYDGLFKECQTCHMRMTEKKLWITADSDMKASILRAVESRSQR